ncbi:MAG: hypothetical protein ACT4QA_14160 [Panacagrimonas sp.]
MSQFRQPVLLLVVLMCASALAACAAPRHRPYDPAVRTQIRSIGVLTPAVTDKVSVRLMVHPGESFGVVGMLVAEGEMSGKTNEFTRVLGERGFRTKPEFRADLLTSLGAAGYALSAIDVFRPIGQYGFLERYPADDGSVDAYLDLNSPLIGYTAAGYDTPYRPTVQLGVRLVRAKDHKVLYQDTISYNAFGDGDGAITLMATREFEFNAFEDLIAGPVRAVDGLREAMRSIGQELARQLR